MHTSNLDLSYLKALNEDLLNRATNKMKRAPSNVREELDKQVGQILDRRIEGLSRKNRKTFLLDEVEGFIGD